ncbi:MAG: hypothetical protein IT428_02995 [Planctomycetaceae bacterium]|nr:hypothetical protein [Planctomycetaceae bacterium]
MRIILAWTLLLAPAMASAAPPAKPKGLAVDVVELKSRPVTLRGLVLGKDADARTTLVAVPRWWIEANAAEFYTEYLKHETDARRTLLTKLVERIDAWKERRADDRRLQTFLDEQKERAGKALRGNDGDVAPCESKLVLVAVPDREIKRHDPADPQARQVTPVAWAEELKDVETRTVTSLRDELQKDKIDIAARMIDLTEWLPPRLDTAEQWAARQAIVEYEYRRQADFQGTGEAYFRTGEGAKPPALADILSSMFQSNLTGGLLDLLDEGPRKPKPSGPPKPVGTAEKEGLDGVRITTLEQDLNARRVTVRTEFWARVPSQDKVAAAWRPIFQWNETADAAKARPDTEARIRKDPQVSRALELVSSLLPGGDGEAATNTAIRFGAAVMEAQQAADARFIHFRAVYTRGLEGPPLTLPK